MKIKTKILMLSMLLGIAVAVSSCEDTKSYSELLTEEEHAVNWYLAQHTVSLQIPENSNFEIGENAPYYKMDKDGYVYMQVINKGDLNDCPKEGDLVYFRFMRLNLKNFQASGGEVWEGNAEDFENYSNTSLVYGNNVLSSTTQYGDGIQVPLEYLGYNCEVNLVIKSPEGFTSDASQCIPYVYNIRYFKAEY